MSEPNLTGSVLTALSGLSDGLATGLGSVPGAAVGVGIARAVAVLLRMGGSIANAGLDVPETVTRMMNEVPLLAGVKTHWDAAIAAKPERVR